MKPLAERLRPTTLDNYIGQQHLVGEGSVIRQMLASGHVSSFILWGPPGVGKTTLAQIIAHQLETPFYTLSAVNCGVKDVRDVIERAKANNFFGSQSPITLIGATTENPSFEVIRPLLSRCAVYVLKSLDRDDLLTLLDRALHEDVILRDRQIEVREHEALLRYSGGDARKLLGILDLMVTAAPADAPIIIDNASVTHQLQVTPMAYDKGGEMHYDIISAFIKSIRGSEPQAALYWLARLIEGGEDPKFIARRLVISAAEDIGLANPNALLIANAAFDAVQKIGWPEGRIPLAEATVYLATSEKSNSAYMGINAALEYVRATGNLDVPLHLRNAPTQLMEQLGYHDGYIYPHDYPHHFAPQQYLPTEALGQQFWKPADNAAETRTAQRLYEWWTEKQ